MTTYFDFTQPAGKNFVPARKIAEFAKKHHLETYNHYGNTILRSASGDCKYSHYNIDPLPDGLEKVTIYMEDIRA